MKRIDFYDLRESELILEDDFTPIYWESETSSGSFSILLPDDAFE